MMHLPPKEFAGRRSEFMRRMGEGTAAVLPAARETVRNRDVHHPFRQDSDFQYLCGFPEPDAVLVLIPGREDGSFILFCRECDPKQEIWTGRRAGPGGAVEQYGADQAFPLSQLDAKMPALLSGCSGVYCSLGQGTEFAARFLGWLEKIRAGVRAGQRVPASLLAVEEVLHEMRLIKSEAELMLMREAGAISARAHCHAMEVCRPGLHEYDLEAALRQVFLGAGARHTAYEPIVGSGANACVLHYTANDAPLREGDLVLIDAGCEVDCYAADISRTFPVNGRFRAEQRDLHDLVCTAQAKAIAAARPGSTFQDVHDAAVRCLTHGLRDLGLLQGEVDGLLETGAFRRFYMHRTSHWLGMDVHDVGRSQEGKQSRALEPGMTMTVEPGLYIRPDDEQVEARWRGIGIRVEDDVLITGGAAEIISDGVSRTAAEVEEWMAAAQR